MIEYPAFLSCPTWRYAEGLTTFADRTPMESGWVRQRKRWLDNYVTIELAFKMSALDFSIWQSWVNINGYNWFRIPLDRFQGAKVPRDIRFITPVQYGYDDWGNVVATATAEVSNVKPNPPPIPPWLGDTLLECRPYNCSSYQDWLIEIGALEEYVGGLAINVTDINDPVPYPFSEVTSPPGGDGKWIYYNNLISSPVQITGYGVGGPNTNLMALDNVTGIIDGPQLCEGEIAVMGAVNATNGLGAKGAIQAAALVGNGSGAWGNWGMEAAIMDLDLNRAPVVMSGALMRNSGSCWSYRWRGTNYNQEDPAYVGISVSIIDNVAGDVRVTLTINNQYTNLIPNQSATFTVLGAAKRLNMFSGYITSTAPYGKTLSNGNYYIVRDVTLVARYGGDSASLTGTQVYGYQSSSPNPDPISNLAPYYPGGNRPYYCYGTAFYNLSCNFGSFMGGLASADYTNEAYWSWEQNFSSYTPPDYCGSV